MGGQAKNIFVRKAQAPLGLGLFVNVWLRFKSWPRVLNVILLRGCAWSCSRWVPLNDHCPLLKPILFGLLSSKSLSLMGCFRTRKFSDLLFLLWKHRSHKSQACLVHSKASSYLLWGSSISPHFGKHCHLPLLTFWALCACLEKLGVNCPQWGTWAPELLTATFGPHISGAKLNPFHELSHLVLVTRNKVSSMVLLVRKWQ